MRVETKVPEAAQLVRERRVDRRVVEKQHSTLRVALVVLVERIDQRCRGRGAVALRDETRAAVDRGPQHCQRFLVVALAVVALQAQRACAVGQMHATARVDSVDSKHQIAISRLAAISEGAGEALDHRDRDRLRGGRGRRGDCREGDDDRDQRGAQLIPHRDFKALENKNAAPNSAAWLLHSAATKVHSRRLACLFCLSRAPCRTAPLPRRSAACSTACLTTLLTATSVVRAMPRAPRRSTSARPTRTTSSRSTCLVSAATN